MACPFCGIIPNDPYPFEPQNGCKHEISFVRDVTVEAVMEAAAELLYNKVIQKKSGDIHVQKLNKTH
jgi:hypothetical protein